MQIPHFSAHASPGAQVEQTAKGHWRLSIPAGEAGQYRLAQMDDYRSLPRRKFLWQPPVTVSFSMRSSGHNLPGTWGLGLWNDPFGFAIAQGAVRLLPALPNAAWFFFASESNYLSFRDDVPAAGQLAGVFSAPRVPIWLFAPGVVLVPLLAFRPAARLLRRLASRLIKEAAAQMTHDPTEWHDYLLVWEAEKVAFGVDGETVLETQVSPHGPLGLVLWIDNQYAAWTPDGRLKYGTLPNESAWIDIKELQVEELQVP